MRVLLTVSYLGTHYVGWQYQENGPSVQAAVEEALQAALGTPVRATGASRTDAGVHALGQRAHFDTESHIPPERYPFVLNRYLPSDIRVLDGQAVPEDFHARFKAAGKTYTYRFYNAPHISALALPTACHVPLPMDADVMDRAVRRLLGTHDFQAFAAAGGQTKTTVRTVTSARVRREGTGVTFTITGTGFLYNMVRIIAGTLIYIGQGRLTADAFTQALKTGSRLCLGPTAPPEGLELTQVYYDPVWGLRGGDMPPPDSPDKEESHE